MSDACASTAELSPEDRRRLLFEVVVSDPCHRALVLEPQILKALRTAYHLDDSRKLLLECLVIPQRTPKPLRQGLENLVPFVTQHRLFPHGVAVFVDKCFNDAKIECHRSICSGGFPAFPCSLQGSPS